MGKGIAASGIRMTKARREALANNPNMSMDELSNVYSPATFMINKWKNKETFSVPKVNYSADVELLSSVIPISKETDDEIDLRLKDRFETLDMLVTACIEGNARSLIVSGPAGLGKSYTVEKRLSEWDSEQKQHTIVHGYVRATGLVKLLYQYRHEGNVIVLDDADAIYYDDISLNLIKAVCDTTENRKVSWLSEAMLIDEETAERIPRTFTFNGTVIFITNLDFDAIITKGHKLAPHLQALVSRSHYIDCGMKTKQDYMVRIHQVVKEGMLADLTYEQKNDVLAFLEENRDRLRELSLRMVVKIGNIRKSNANWRKLANITCCK